MPDHLRALVVVLILAPLAFAFARVATRPLIADADFTRRRNLWLALTLIVFLTHNFWICMLLAGGLLWYASRREHNVVALYFFLFFALPPLPMSIPGFGVVNFIFDLDYLRLLSLAVLAPAALALLHDRESLPPGRSLSDRILLGYVAYNLVLILLSGTFTNFLRHVFLQCVDVLLPYYVTSRALRRPEQFRDALASFVVGAGVLAAIGIFEAGKGWLIYAPLKEALDSSFGYLNVLMRGETQRAMSSTGHPIALGYVMAIAIGFWLYLQPFVAKPANRVLPFLLLIGALLATLSRGPWAGAVAVALVFVLSGPQPLFGLIRLGLGGSVAFVAILLTPAGNKLIDLIPFIGQSNEETINYRQQLIDYFVPVILDSPFSGASDYLFSADVENLRQGEGIVDVVNSFIGVGLHSGVVGVFIFAGFFISVGFSVLHALLRHTASVPEARRLSQALLAVLVGIVVIIFTVSSITVIPYLYWAVAGVAMAYVGAVADFGPRRTATATTAAGARRTATATTTAAAAATGRPHADAARPRHRPGLVPLRGRARQSPP